MLQTSKRLRAYPVRGCTCAVFGSNFPAARPTVMQFYGCVDAVFDCLSLFGRHDLLATSFGIIGAKLKLKVRLEEGGKEKRREFCWRLH